MKCLNFHWNMQPYQYDPFCKQSANVLYFYTIIAKSVVSVVLLQFESRNFWNQIIYSKSLCFGQKDVTWHMSFMKSLFFIIPHVSTQVVCARMLYSLLYFDFHPHFPLWLENYTSCFSELCWLFQKQLRIHMLVLCLTATDLNNDKFRDRTQTFLQ